jgi:hypothetical protein
MDLKINKKGLGRGLSSLMGEVSGEQAENLGLLKIKYLFQN